MCDCMAYCSNRDWLTRHILDQLRMAASTRAVVNCQTRACVSAGRLQFDAIMNSRTATHPAHGIALGSCLACVRGCLYRPRKR